MSDLGPPAEPLEPEPFEPEPFEVPTAPAPFEVDEPELFGAGPDGVHPDPEHDALDRLRSFCAMLPETAEVNPFGHPTFRVATKTFAAFELVADRPAVLVKTTPDEQAALVARPGFTADPDTGHHGWTSVHLDEIDWDEVDHLVIASYRLVAPPEYVTQLDGLLGAG